MITYLRGLRLRLWRLYLSGGRGLRHLDPLPPARLWPGAPGGQAEQAQEQQQPHGELCDQINTRPSISLVITIHYSITGRGKLGLGLIL